jgi:hypothetical protein
LTAAKAKLCQAGLDCALIDPPKRMAVGLDL